MSNRATGFHSRVVKNPGGVPGGGREGVGGVARGRTFWRAPVPRAHSACAGLDANSASKLVFIDWTPKPLVNRRVISLDTVASLLRGDTVPGDTASSYSRDITLQTPVRLR